MLKADMNSYKNRYIPYPNFYCYAHCYIPIYKIESTFLRLNEFRYFIHPNMTERIAETSFEQKLYDTHSTGKVNKSNCSRLHGLQKAQSFCGNWLKWCYVVWDLGLNLWDLLSLIYCVGCSAAEIYNTVKTVSTLYDRQMCLMCTCTYVQDNTDALDFFSFFKKYTLLIFCWA